MFNHDLFIDIHVFLRLQDNESGKRHVYILSNLLIRWNRVLTRKWITNQRERFDKQKERITDTMEQSTNKEMDY
jgi:hypothetical protein